MAVFTGNERQNRKEKMNCMNMKKILCVMAAMAVIGTSALPVCEADSTQMSFGITASAAQKLSAPENLKASVSGTSVTLKWDAVKGADGYRIYEYDRTSKKYVRIKTVSSNKTVIKSVSPGKHYYKIAAVVKSGKKYSAGYATKSVSVNIKSTGNTTSTEAVKPSSSANTDAIQLAKKMGNGWNLGNTMESWATWLGSSADAYDYENAWGQPTTTKEMITGLKKAGFNSVRVPVAWSNMISDDGKYTISKSYFDRIDEIVGYVLDNDMYCIINIHWDGGWWEDFGSADEKTRTAAMEKYTSMWTQISGHYAKYSDKLIFESANEELGSATKGKANFNESYERVNTINQTFVDIVRNSGGKNKNRYLLIAGYDTDISKTCDKRFVMPSDTVSGRLLVSVHYYTPSTFCIAESRDNSWGYKGSWGTESDISAMEKDFEKMKKFTDAGYGVIIGEYGVCHEKSGSKYLVKEGTDKFFDCVTDLAEKYGYCAMLWDCNDWYNRNTCSFNDKVFADIYK